MRRRALVAAGGALWLFLAASPALADGGPHVLTVNNGTSGLAGDCASCHRAHTAQAADLLRSTVPGLCTNCHNGTKATTDVLDGVQYVPDGSGDPTGTVLGALRGGGFTYALIDSSHAARSSYSLGSGFASFTAHVGALDVTAKQKVTSAHSGNGTVWGNGAIANGAGAVLPNAVVLDCAKCHNPHGNGQYRILQTTPGEDWTALGAGTFAPAPNDVDVQEAAPTTLTTGQVRNYTILPGALTSDVLALTGYAPTAGDYWRSRYDVTGAKTWLTTTLPADVMNRGWNGSAATNAAAAGGTPPPNSNGLMTAWCLACHTRFSGLPSVVIDPATGLPDVSPSSITAMTPIDPVFTYKHGTVNVGCEQCHVSHGSNATMTRTGSLADPDPSGATPATAGGAGAGGGLTSGDSRLLKVDERGTCQLCHDPTQTVGYGVYTGPTPTPGL